MTASSAIGTTVTSLCFYVFRSHAPSGIVTKPWYSVGIRCARIFIWLWALAFDCSVLFATPREATDEFSTILSPKPGWAF